MPERFPLRPEPPRISKRQARLNRRLLFASVIGSIVLPNTLEALTGLGNNWSYVVAALVLGIVLTPAWWWGKHLARREGSDPDGH